MANSRDTQPSINYKIKWFFANTLKYVILLSGSLTSATGGFKAIPFLLSIYPLNLIVLPSLIVTILCLISALSGFIAAWSGCAESMTELTDNLLNQDKQRVEPSVLIERLDIKSELCGFQKNAYESLCEQLKLTLTQKRTQYHSEILKQVIALEMDTNEKLKKINKPKQYPRFLKNYAYYINLIVEKISRVLSILLVAFGSIVVIGLGTLSNLSFVEYSGFPATAFFMAICVIASLSKQLNQLSFNGKKQYEKFCEILGLNIISKNFEEAMQEKLNVKESSIQILEQALYELEAINLTIKATSLATSTDHESLSSLVRKSETRVYSLANMRASAAAAKSEINPNPLGILTKSSTPSSSYS